MASILIFFPLRKIFLQVSLFTGKKIFLAEKKSEMGNKINLNTPQYYLNIDQNYLNTDQNKLITDHSNKFTAQKYWQI